MHGAIPDGGTYNGKMVIKKVDADHCSWDFVGKDGDGGEMKMGGKFTRRK